MADPFVAEIRIYPFNFAPRGWAFCDGQLLPISQNTALFSLLGTTYGGDGRTSFALPDLQGRTPMAPGQGPGLSLYDLGQQGGEETVTLIETEIPAHSHVVSGTTDTAVTNVPDNAYLARPLGRGANLYSPSTSGPVSMQPTSISGSHQAHNNMQPYLTLSFCIALQGIFPPRW